MNELSYYLTHISFNFGFRRNYWNWKEKKVRGKSVKDFQHGSQKEFSILV